MKTTFPGKIKDQNRWIAAGDGFRWAARLLSDGAFKLFFHIALEADSRTGCVETTFKTLADDLHKSKRSIGIYAAELHDKGICKVQPGENQYCRTRFEILDDYWPYVRENDFETAGSNAYIMAIREAYLGLDCTANEFNSADIQTAAEFEEEGIALETIKEALLLGAVRKYSSWLDGGKSDPIGSLKYFKNLVSEIRKQPLPAGYREYLKKKTRGLSIHCREKGFIDADDKQVPLSQKRK
jgi:hypothetical protein